MAKTYPGLTTGWDRIVRWLEWISRKLWWLRSIQEWPENKAQDILNRKCACRYCRG